MNREKMEFIVLEIVERKQKKKKNGQKWACNWLILNTKPLVVLRCFRQSFCGVSNAQHKLHYRPYKTHNNARDNEIS